MTYVKCKYTDIENIEKIDLETFRLRPQQIFYDTEFESYYMLCYDYVHTKLYLIDLFAGRLHKVIDVVNPYCVSFEEKNRIIKPNYEHVKETSFVFQKIGRVEVEEQELTRHRTVVTEETPENIYRRIHDNNMSPEDIEALRNSLRVDYIVGARINHANDE